MRLVQRHGRVDRIGSRHRSVALGCFFPAAHLDQLLHLEETLQRKLAYAHAAWAMGDNPELFVNGGSQAAAQSGEEYRKRLAQALANPVTREAVLALPWSCGSGFTNPSAARSGYVFCLRMGRGFRSRTWFRFVPVAPGVWEPVVEDGEVVVDADVLTSLTTADPGGPDRPREVLAEAAAGAYRAWEAARADAWAQWMRYTDPNELIPEAPKAFRDAEPLPALDPAEVHLIAWMAVQGRDRVGPPE
jgi:hypothetical protein